MPRDRPNAGGSLDNAEGMLTISITMTSAATASIQPQPKLHRDQESRAVIDTMISLRFS